MAGSVNEFTSDRPQERFSYTALRGGHWRTTDEYYFRIATRNSRLPQGYSWETGIRLAADLERGERSSPREDR
jgi:hypothetical protein